MSTFFGSHPSDTVRDTLRRTRTTAFLAVTPRIVISVFPRFQEVFGVESSAPDVRDGRTGPAPPRRRVRRRLRPHRAQVGGGARLHGPAREGGAEDPRPAHVWGEQEV